MIIKDFILKILGRIFNPLSLEAKLCFRRNIIKSLNLLGVNIFFRFIHRKKLSILIFHGISEKNFSYHNRRSFPSSNFIKILTYLKKKGYIFITLTDWVEIVKNKRKTKKKYVILTFDDGFKNVIINAYPIMKKIGAKGCFYVTSGIIGKNQLIWADYLDVLIRNISDNRSSFKFIYKGQELNYNLNSKRNINNCIGQIKYKLKNISLKERISHLEQFKIKNNIQKLQKVPKDYLIANWDDFMILTKDILEIGGHTKSHPNLKLLNDEDEIYQELYESKLEIENKIGYTIKHFAYPGGYYNKTVIQNIKKYGYLTGVPGEEGFNSTKTDLFQLKRLNIKNDFLMFKFKISGLYYFLLKYFNIDLE